MLRLAANTSQVRRPSVPCPLLAHSSTSRSQFFVTLTSDPAKLKKLTGKYVAFGQVDLDDAGSRTCLERLDALGDGNGGTSVKVWIENCNVVA